MGRTQESKGDSRVLAAWAAKRRRFFLALAAFCVIQTAILLFWIARPVIAARSDPFLAQVLVIVVVIVTVVGLALFELYDSTCPSCGRGLAPWTQTCPRCAAKLTG